MKISKKATTILAFSIGACVFVTTALADMALGSGYDQLKASAKRTSQQLEQGLNNYTLDLDFSLTDNERTLLHSTSTQKIDNANQMNETTSTDLNAYGETTNHYSYSDSQRNIWKSTNEDKYYVTNYPSDVTREARKAFRDPFKEKGAAEMEKIVDAVVGNLKDYVQAVDRPEGGKAFSGSLSAAQVPALINAVSSFGVKQMIGDQNRMDRKSQLPEIDSDIFVNKVTGSASENSLGLLENVTGTAVLSGKEKNGAEHDLTLTVTAKLTAVGTTKITPPDLTGAKVEETAANGYEGFSKMYEGTYKNNIIVVKDGKFVKIGERVLEITKVESSKVSGRYSETVKPGFEADYPDKENFTFEMIDQADAGKGSPMSMFSYTNSHGEQTNGQLHMGGTGKVYLDLGIQVTGNNSYRSYASPNYDGEFLRVFAE
jgi:hypothetical protein